MAITILVLFLVGPHYSQAQTTSYIHLEGGSVHPLHPALLRDWYQMGYSVGGGLTGTVGNAIGLRPSLNYSRLFLDEERVRDAVRAGSDQEVNGGRRRHISASLDLLLGFTSPSPAALYALVGIGYYRGETQELVLENGSVAVPRLRSDTQGLMYIGGVGVRGLVSERMGVLLEAQVQWLQREGTTAAVVVPVSVGILATF